MQHTQTLDNFTTYQVDLSKKACSRQDVEEIAEAFQDQYGDHYFPEFLDAKKLHDLIAAPNTYTFVARADDGTFVGTGSLIVKGRRAELGRVVVPKLYRGQDVFQSKKFKGVRVYDVLIKERMKLAGELGVNMLYTAAVTNHAGSQAGLVNKSFTAVGLQDQKYIPITPDEDQVGRESTVLMVYRGSDFSVHCPTVYIPKDLVPVVEGTLTALTENLNPPIFKPFVDLERRIDTETIGAFKATIVKEHGLDKGDNSHVCYTAMSPTDPGAKGERMDVFPFAEHVLKRVEEEGLRYAEVEVAVNNASAVKTVNTLREYGFKFAGFLPGWIRNGRSYDAVLLSLSRPGQQDPDKLKTTEDTERVKQDYLRLN